MFLSLFQHLFVLRFLENVKEKYKMNQPLEILHLYPILKNVFYKKNITLMRDKYFRTKI